MKVKYIHGKKDIRSYEVNLVEMIVTVENAKGEVRDVVFKGDFGISKQMAHEAVIRVVRKLTSVSSHEENYDTELEDEENDY